MAIIEYHERPDPKDQDPSLRAAQGRKGWLQLPHYVAPGAKGMQRCARCRGEGEVEKVHPTRFIRHEPCPGCGGSGKVIPVVHPSGWYITFFHFHSDGQVDPDELPYLKKLNAHG